MQGTGLGPVSPGEVCAPPAAASEAWGPLAHTPPRRPGSICNSVRQHASAFLLPPLLNAHRFLT